jgi:hypothetical protein
MDCSTISYELHYTKVIFKELQWNLSEPKLLGANFYVWKRQLTIILQLQSWLTIMKSSRN